MRENGDSLANFFMFVGFFSRWELAYIFTKNTLGYLWDLGEFHAKNDNPKPPGPGGSGGINHGTRAPGSYIAPRSILDDVPFEPVNPEEPMDTPTNQKVSNPELEYSSKGFFTSTQNKNNFQKINPD